MGSDVEVPHEYDDITEVLACLPSRPMPGSPCTWNLH